MFYNRCLASSGTEDEYSESWKSRAVSMDFEDYEMFDWLENQYADGVFDRPEDELHELARELFPEEYNRRLFDEMIEAIHDVIN